MEPPTCLLRPSGRQTAHGAEFSFTPYRPGRHVIRFTIALERSGTVLQQVETEFDVLDGDHPQGAVTPHAVSHRGDTGR